jgi:hypothetical protein
MELRPFRALRGMPRFKERRPGLWIDRQVFIEEGRTLVLPLLVGLVRLGDAAGVDIPEEAAAADAVSKRVGALVAAKADGDPCLLATRAPLSAALATTRRPDFTVTSDSGPRHDFFRINDYAQHVELQGLVKNAEAELLSGRDLWDAAAQFSVSPAAAKLPGAKFKLCAIVEDRLLKETGVRPEARPGVLACSFEDPVY